MFLFSVWALLWLSLIFSFLLRYICLLLSLLSIRSYTELLLFGFELFPSVLEVNDFCEFAPFNDSLATLSLIPLTDRLINECCFWLFDLLKFTELRLFNFGTKVAFTNGFISVLFLTSFVFISKIYIELMINKTRMSINPKYLHAKLSIPNLYGGVDFNWDFCKLFLCCISWDIFGHSTFYISICLILKFWLFY